MFTFAKRIRRRMAYSLNSGGRFCGPYTYAPRKRVVIIAGSIAIAVFTLIVYSFYSTSGDLPREDEMEQKIAEMQNQILFLEAQYRARHEELLFLSKKSTVKSNASVALALANSLQAQRLSPEAMAVYKNVTGTRTATGLNLENRKRLRLQFIFQLMPHLLLDYDSMRPAFHMSGGREFVEVVLGVPTVKRDKESYLMITISHLVEGLTKEDEKSTLIVVLVAEIDLEYVMTTAHQIEQMFPKQVESGLIEVISPSASYYPDLEALEPTLGDSFKRTKWRTKQNLDAIFLMAYAQPKGTYYMMLEDDIIARKNYMMDIKFFTAQISQINPHWLVIEYCQIGGIGKLMRSAHLIHFTTYVQLFYNNMPIDWLVESYLVDKVCTIDKTSKQCQRSRLAIRPRYEKSLFQHIGLYSSLKGKIQKLKDSSLVAVQEYYPHKNPAVSSIKTDIEEYSEHTVQKAYDGVTFFWGVKPKKGSTIEFWFPKPIALESYTFRSGNVEHVSDKFYDSVVEVMSPNGNSTFTVVGTFDEFGLAEAELHDAGLLSAIRIRVKKSSTYWVILSEIHLKTHEESR